MAGRVVVSTLNNDTGVLATQNGMTGIAKAWIRYDGNAGSITGSYNVASVTKNGQGDYTINYTTALPNSNYAFVGAMAMTWGRTIQVDASSDTSAPTTQSTTAVRFTIKSVSSNAPIDMANIYVAILSS